MTTEPGSAAEAAAFLGVAEQALRFVAGGVPQVEHYIAAVNTLIGRMDVELAEVLRLLDALVLPRTFRPCGRGLTLGWCDTHDVDPVFDPETLEQVCPVAAAHAVLVRHGYREPQ